jgi:hypothetical protein
MIVIAPTDISLENDILPVLIEDLPSPLSEDITLMQFIVSSHIIVRTGTIPKAIFDRLPVRGRILKINMKGVDVVFQKEQGAENESTGQQNKQIAHLQVEGNLHFQARSRPTESCCLKSIAHPQPPRPYISRLSRFFCPTQILSRAQSTEWLMRTVC